MKEAQFPKLIKKFSEVIIKNNSSILTGVAVTGLITTSVLAVRATPKALCIIDDELYYLMGEDVYKEKESGNAIEDRACFLSFQKKVKLTWRCYIPAIVVGFTTIGCIIYANKINLRRNAALASVYSLTEVALKEYQSKVVETIGKNKELKIRDNISAEHIKTNPSNTNEIIITGKGDVLCYDSLSGRYFKSDIEKIRRIINNLNRDLMSNMFLSLNEFYYELGLPKIKLGDEMGWDIDKGLIDVSFSAQLTENNEPCLVLNYEITPKFLK